MKVSLEVVNFDEELKRIEREVNNIANPEIRKLVEFGTQQLKVVTPVDTGKARRGWDNRMVLSLKGQLMSATIFNPVEYIDRLNRGHSKQAPSYFIEQTLSTIGLLTFE
jgi:hypothetical protein